MFDLNELKKEFEGCPCGVKHELNIKEIAAGSGITAETGEILKRNGFGKKLLLVADENTLAAACGVTSALKDFIIPDDTALIGEIGLAGEIRAVSGIEKRISEAEKLGFKRCIVPARNKLSHIKTNAELIPVYSIKDTFNKI